MVGGKQHSTQKAKLCLTAEQKQTAVQKQQTMAALKQKDRVGKAGVLKQKTLNDLLIICG